jgi:hypothetical protein
MPDDFEAIRRRVFQDAVPDVAARGITVDRFEGKAAPADSAESN